MESQSIPVHSAQMQILRSVPIEIHFPRGSLIERAGSPYVSQLASSSCGKHGLSGTPAHLQSMQIIVQSPSNCPASSRAGSSPSQVPDDNDECTAGCTRVTAGSGSTGYVCGNWPPFSKPES
jgi:hypothetical protein